MPDATNEHHRVRRFFCRISKAARIGSLNLRLDRSPRNGRFAPDLALSVGCIQPRCKYDAGFYPRDLVSKAQLFVQLGNFVCAGYTRVIGGGA